jgi:antitoxin PrlF
MVIATSKVTAQGQISVPADVRRRLGIVPGSILKWEEEEGGKIVVRRSGEYTFEDIHKVLFPEGPPKRRSLKELKEGIRSHLRKKHALR